MRPRISVKGSVHPSVRYASSVIAKIDVTGYGKRVFLYQKTTSTTSTTPCLVRPLLTQLPPVPLTPLPQLPL